METVRFKKLNPRAATPVRASKGAGAVDLVAINKTHSPNGYIEYGTGIAVEIPEGFVGILAARSSISNMSLALANGIGVIDSDYRGEIKCRFKHAASNTAKEYAIGDRIAQLLIMPALTFDLEETTNLSETSRADGGFGSTGV